MLISYNQNYEKIAMGLLSYIADFKSVDRLQDEMESYIQSEDKQLFLWKDTDTDNIVGIIGVEYNDVVALVRHVAINPSFRNEGIVYKLLNKLQSLFPNHAINGTLETAPIIAKWAQKLNETDDLVDEK
ncbi:GNAT family N-acetyltransferase [Jeotgalibaca sp. A127]|uniref:GNAT family N-acetyltransferase n=1 Tax=Jeotgalibaca sp. A127 TaxID=3457324 RepID=UPI003FD640A0